MDYTMPYDNLTCASCGKTNAKGGSYCIHCGAILNAIYCSSCGTKNPDGLENCLECGATMPSLAGFRWNPIVTVLNPTSAMIEEKQLGVAENHVDDATPEWRRKKINKSKKVVQANPTSENTHT